ncbi:HAAS signaling domain-containing protein [Krasilnikovia sp. MM14-A1259]|uniref:HAAS signaling domain-containing protein n=1 Tax=Krasilnikovia sp. MM14-A1259 TaxID=3373539 RepID=UPI003822E02C
MADTAPLAHTDVLVLDYLAALWAETEDLAPELRDELMTTVADYVARRRAAGGEDPERIVRRLGPPEDLAAAVRRGRMPPHLRLPALAPVAAVPAPAAATTDYVAVTLLTVGGVFLPLVAPLAGMALVSGSPRWTPAAKAAAWVLSAVPALCGFLLMVAGVLLTSEIGPLVLLAYLAMVAGPFVAGLTLLPGLSARSQAAR